MCDYTELIIYGSWITYFDKFSKGNSVNKKKHEKKKHETF